MWDRRSARCGASSCTAPISNSKRLTPANKDELLFDDVLWVRRARQEHDAFADALRERGIEVLLLGRLLAGTLAVDGVRERVVDETLCELDLGPRLREELRGWMADLPVEQLAEVLIGGVALDELPFRPSGLAAAADPQALVIAPLPNHLFTRDTSCWVYGGVSVNHMAYSARRREAVHLSAIYRHHPLFADAQREIWSDAMPAPRGWRAATSSCWGAAPCSSGWASAPGPARSRRWPSACSKPARRARCSLWTCPSSAPRCTSTPS